MKNITLELITSDLSERVLREIAQAKLIDQTATFTAEAMIAVENAQLSVRHKYDVLLTSVDCDYELLLGAKQVIQRKGFTVFGFAIGQPDFDEKTLRCLRQEMLKARSLIVAFRAGSPPSTDMCWQLGYFEGYCGAVCTLPIFSAHVNELSQGGILAIYPYLKSEGADCQSLWVHRGTAPVSTLGKASQITDFRTLGSWLERKAQI